MTSEAAARAQVIVAGLALVLAICLLVLPWFDISVDAGPFTISASYSATSAPDGWLGILAFIAALLIVADVAVERFSPQTNVPTIGGTRADTRFILAVVAAAFLALKFLFHVHFDLFGWGFYLDVILTAALVFFAAQARNVASGRGSTRSRSAGAGGATDRR
jgi:predicted small integral membrane protein